MVAPDVISDMLDIGKVYGRIHAEHEQPILGARSWVLCHIPVAKIAQEVSRGRSTTNAEDHAEEASNNASMALNIK